MWRFINPDMISENLKSRSLLAGIREKTRAYVQLLKLRLSSLVALSAVFGYAMAAGGAASWLQLLLIGLGGLMVTGASNVLNQIFEREYDGVMRRTAQRPLPTGRVTNGESLIYGLLLATGGTLLLGTFFNLPAALLGIIGLLSYAFVYTPMKRISPFSVFVGAIPGGLPPLIGWVAFTGTLGEGGLILFAFQFFWQFPHFWAIAWQLDEDYQKAGFRMLPSSAGKTDFSAKMILIYSLALIPLVLFPFKAGLVGLPGAGVLALLGLLFSWPAWQLFRKREDRYAKQLMFASFLYLPLTQLTFLFG
jgi:heme o synthase